VIRSRDPEAGLSLPEVLVALAIMGLMTGVAILGLGMADRGDRAEAEAMRLADRLRLASDDALLSSGVLALVWNERGYRFLRWDASTQGWSESPLPLLAAPHALPPALRLEQPGVDGNPPLLISFDPPRPPVQLRISGAGGDWAVSFDGLDAAAAALGSRDG
jgi:general secretion pathway protein H